MAAKVHQGSRRAQGRRQGHSKSDNTFLAWECRNRARPLVFYEGIIWMFRTAFQCCSSYYGRRCQSAASFHSFQFLAVRIHAIVNKFRECVQFVQFFKMHLKSISTHTLHLVKHLGRMKALHAPVSSTFLYNSFWFFHTLDECLPV